MASALRDGAPVPTAPAWQRRSALGLPATWAPGMGSWALLGCGLIPVHAVLSGLLLGSPLAPTFQLSGPGLAGFHANALAGALGGDLLGVVGSR